MHGIGPRQAQFCQRYQWIAVEAARIHESLKFLGRQRTLLHCQIGHAARVQHAKVRSPVHHRSVQQIDRLGRLRMIESNHRLDAGDGDELDQRVKGALQGGAFGNLQRAIIFPHQRQREGGIERRTVWRIALQHLGRRLLRHRPKPAQRFPDGPLPIRRGGRFLQIVPVRSIFDLFREQSHLLELPTARRQRDADVQG